MSLGILSKLSGNFRFRLLLVVIAVLCVVTGAAISLMSFSNYPKNPQITILPISFPERYTIDFNSTESFSRYIPVLLSWEHDIKLSVSFSANRTVNLYILNESEYSIWQQNQTFLSMFVPISTGFSANTTMFNPPKYNQTYNIVFSTADSSGMTLLDANITGIVEIYKFEYPGQMEFIQNTIIGIFIVILGLIIGYFSVARDWLSSLLLRANLPIFPIKQHWFKSYLKVRQNQYRSRLWQYSGLGYIGLFSVAFIILLGINSAILISSLFSSPLPSISMVYLPVVYDYIFKSFLAGLASVIGTLFLVNIFFEVIAPRLNDLALYAGYKLGYYKHYSYTFELAYNDAEKRYLHKTILLIMVILIQATFSFVSAEELKIYPRFLWFITYVIVFLMIYITGVITLALSDVSKSHGTSKVQIKEMIARGMFDIIASGVQFLTLLFLVIWLIVYMVNLLYSPLLDSTIFAHYFSSSPSTYEKIANILSQWNFFALWMTGTFLIAGYALIYKAVPALLSSPVDLIVRVVTIAGVEFSVRALGVLEAVVASEFESQLLGIIFSVIVGWILSDLVNATVKKLRKGRISDKKLQSIFKQI